MIQRIQTLFLILTVGVFGALFRLPLATSDTATAQFLSDKIFDITDHVALLSLAGSRGCIVFDFDFSFQKPQNAVKGRVPHYFIGHIYFPFWLFSFLKMNHHRLMLRPR